MAYDLRNRGQINVNVATIDIYDDPIEVPVQKMSFSVSQWKGNNETDGKWSSNMMHFAYLQNNELWLEFDIPNTNFMLPKKWTEVATTSDIHDEMLVYHNKYKKNVPIWIWKDFQTGLRRIEAPMAYNINDIGIADDVHFVEIIAVEGVGPVYKCKALDVSMSNQFYAIPEQVLSIGHNNINILLSKSQRQGATNLESLFKAQAIHYKKLDKRRNKGDKSNNKQKMKCLRAGLYKLMAKEETGRATFGIDCTVKDFEGKTKLASYVVSVIGGQWKTTKAFETIAMSNVQFAKLFSKKYLKNEISKGKSKNEISKGKSYDVEDGYSYLRFRKEKGKLYLSVNLVENVGGVVMKGSQKKRDEIKKKIREEKKALKAKKQSK